MRRRGIAPSTAAHIGHTGRGKQPATIPQTENCEPIEISICRARMTSVMPTAATRIGAALTHVAKLAWKNAGRNTPSTSSRRVGQQRRRFRDGTPEKSFASRRWSGNGCGQRVMPPPRLVAVWPSAISSIFSWVASPRESSPTIVPACITAMRSLMPSISGSSDEIMMIASPPPASWPISR